MDDKPIVDFGMEQQFSIRCMTDAAKDLSKGDLLQLYKDALRLLFIKDNVIADIKKLNNDLTPEQEFEIIRLCQQAKTLSRETLGEMLIECMKSMMLKDNLISALYKKEVTLLINA